MNQQVFAELRTRVVYSNDPWISFRKEFKDVSFIVPPSRLELLVNDQTHNFEVVHINSTYSEKNPDIPIVIMLKAESYPSAFIQLFKDDPNWVEYEKSK